jgi:hypothetical protein
MNRKVFEDRVVEEEKKEKKESREWKMMEKNAGVFILLQKV